MTKKQSVSSSKPAAVFALLAAVCSLLALPLALMGRTASFAAMAVLLLAALVLLGVTGSKLPHNKQ